MLIFPEIKVKWILDNVPEQEKAENGGIIIWYGGNVADLETYQRQKPCNRITPMNPDHAFNINTPAVG